MIDNGGTMKYGGQCENVKLQMRYYQLKTHMFVIGMGGCDIILGGEWLRTLGPIIMDFENSPSTLLILGTHITSM